MKAMYKNKTAPKLKKPSKKLLSQFKEFTRFDKSKPHVVISSKAS